MDLVKHLCAPTKRSWLLQGAFCSSFVAGRCLLTLFKDARGKACFRKWSGNGFGVSPTLLPPPSHDLTKATLSHTSSALHGGNVACSRKRGLSPKRKPELSLERDLP